MIDFAGFNMPVSYKGVNHEHEVVRTGVGIFDVSHMGEFLISGADALNLIQLITSNDASKLKIGQAQYSCFPNENNGIVDDLLVYKIKEESYLLVVNASNIEKDWDWINKYKKENNVDIRNLSNDYCLLAIQGPKTIDAIKSLTSVNLANIPYYNFVVSDFAGIEHVIISATGYTGSGGFEIYCKNNEAEQIWNKVLETGTNYGIEPIGLAARNTLRLEMGYCLYGNDINDTTSPIEAGLGWITKFSKKDFINKENLKAQKENGVTRKLVGFELVEKGIPRKGYDILNDQNKKIGIVTSGTMSPSLNKAIGMAYVESNFSALNTEISIQIRKKTIKAKVVSLPFYKS